MAEKDSWLKDVFYATLSHYRVPIRESYKARFRAELPSILMLPREAQEKTVESFAMEIVYEYRAERKLPELLRRREERVVPVPAVPVTEAPPEERVLLTGFMTRRCKHPDHEKPKWVKANLEVEKEFPDGKFIANLNEERLAHCLPCPGYYRSRRFNGYCPYHRHKIYKTYLSTVAKWAEVYLWMFKASGGRQGLDLGILKDCIRKLDSPLKIEDFERPLTWKPPDAVFEYWKMIGWAAPERIEEAWEATEKDHVEYEKIWGKLKIEEER